MLWSKVYQMSGRVKFKGKGETYRVEMCFEVGGGMKHSEVRDQEGGECGGLIASGSRPADKFS